MLAPLLGWFGAALTGCHGAGPAASPAPADSAAPEDTGDPGPFVQATHSIADRGIPYFGPLAGDWANVVRAAGDVNADGFDDLLIGAPHSDIAWHDDGAAYLVLGSANPSGGDLGRVGLRFTLSAGADYAVGTDLAGIGDADGDGFDDLVIGVPGYRPTAEVWGAAALLSGTPSPTALDLASSALMTSRWTSPLWGAIAPAGDLNADGYADLAVSVCMDGRSYDDDFRVFVRSGGPIAPAQPSDTRVEFLGPSLPLSSCRALGGDDITGDGIDDLAAVRANAGARPEYTGVYLFAGAASAEPWTPEEPLANWYSNFADDRFGYDLDFVGDVNHDGYGDILVGAVTMDSPQHDCGAAYLILGSANPTGGAPDAHFLGVSAGEMAGTSVAGIGDIDEDSIPDILIGAPGWQVDSPGAAYIFYGTPAWSTRSLAFADVVITGAPDQVGLGLDAAGVGDVNADGHPDFLLGVAWSDPSRTGPGLSYLVLGGQI